MTLFDVDKTNDDRGTPSPNTHDVLSPGAMMSKNTVSSSYSTTGIATNPQRMIWKNNMILWYDDQNRVIAVKGFIPSLANYPVEITAIYGYDVFVDILGLPKP